MLRCRIVRCRVGCGIISRCRVAGSRIGLRSLTEVWGELAFFPSSRPVAVLCGMCSSFLGFTVGVSVRATAIPEVRRRSATDAYGMLAGDPKSIFILRYKC
jgi:hypothetical protein